MVAVNGVECGSAGCEATRVILSRNLTRKRDCCSDSEAGGAELVVDSGSGGEKSAQ
jgi:hypothetical protein